MNVVIAGTDKASISAAIENEGHQVTRVDIGNGQSLENAGIESADAYVLTEMEQATSIVVAKDSNPDLQVIVYDEGSLPDFATKQTDIVIDPRLIDPPTVAEELA